MGLPGAVGELSGLLEVGGEGVGLGLGGGECGEQGYVLRVEFAQKGVVGQERLIGVLLALETQNLLAGQLGAQIVAQILQFHELNLGEGELLAQFCGGEVAAFRGGRHQGL